MSKYEIKEAGGEKEGRKVEDDTLLCLVSRGA